MKIQAFTLLFLIPFTAFSQKKIIINDGFTGISTYGCNYALIYKTDSNKRLEFFNCRNKKVISREYTKSFNHKSEDLLNSRNGKELTFDEFGNIITHCIYKDGAKTGIENEYFTDGKIKRTCTYFDNKKDQTETRFFPSGKISNLRNYKMGTLVGAEISYKNNGDTLSVGHYKEGKPWQGMVKVHYKNGYCAFEKFENYKLMDIYAFDINDDTSTVYEYHYINNIRLVHSIKSYKNGKLNSTKNYDSDYREDLKKPKTGPESINSKKDTSSKMVDFLGGIDELNNFLINELIYPVIAKEKGISGVVWVVFMVGREGNIIDIFTDEKSDKMLIKEALRVINLSDGMWLPGSFSGNTVTSICRVPITFELD